MQPTIDPDSAFTGDRDLVTLHRWLSYEIKTSVLFVGIFFLPGLVYRLVLFGAVLFTPFMLWKLARLQKWSWIVAFAVMVIGPTVVLFYSGSLSALFVGRLVSIGLFYGFTWILKMATTDWMESQKGRALLRHYESLSESRAGASRK